MVKARMKWVRFAVALVLYCGVGFEHNVYATITEGSASGTDSIAIGNASASSKDYATALGANATAGGANSIAIGGSEKKAASGNIAATTGASASGDSSISIGNNSSAGGTFAVALGSNAKGLANFSVAIGYKSNAKTSEYATAVGTQSVSTGIYAASFASYAKSYTDYSLALGYKATVGYSSSTTLSGLSGIAIGRSAVTSANYGVALGAYAQAAGLNSIAIGGNDKTGAGNAAYAQGAGAIAVGNQAQATVENAIAFGVGAKASANAVALGQGSIANTADTVSVGSSATTGGFTRKIVNVMEGSANTDAATYGQLLTSGTYNATAGTITFETHSGTGGFTVTGLPTTSESESGAAYRGDGKTIEISASRQISVKADGKVTSADTGIVTGQTVYAALVENKEYAVGADGSVTIKTNGGDDAFTITGIGSSGIDTTMLGDVAKLSDLGLGDNLTDSVLHVNDKIGALSVDINKVGAGAAALAALRPEGFHPDDKWSFAVGYGHYKNANAGALGAFFKPNGETTFSFGGTIGNGDSMMNAGVSFRFGTRSKMSVYRSDAAPAQELASLWKRYDTLTAQNAEQRKEIVALRADNERIKVDNKKIKEDNERMQKQIAMILSKLEMAGLIAMAE